MLEHHAHAVAPQLGQLGVVVTHDIFAIDDDFAGGRFDQARDAAHQGRFAAARQSHHDKGFARVDFEGYVIHADDVAGLFLDFGARQGPIQVFQGPFRISAKDFPDVSTNYFGLLGHLDSRYRPRSAAILART